MITTEVMKWCFLFLSQKSFTYFEYNDNQFQEYAVLGEDIHKCKERFWLGLCHALRDSMSSSNMSSGKMCYAVFS